MPRAASAWFRRSRASVPEAGELGLPRRLRLRKTRDYQRVQRGGIRIRSSHLLILYEPTKEGRTRVGITVSRKVGNAVRRNRVKRWLREVVRTTEADIRGAWDVVIIAHASAANAGQAVLHQEVAHAWTLLGERG